MGITDLETREDFEEICVQNYGKTISTQFRASQIEATSRDIVSSWQTFYAAA